MSFQDKVQSIDKQSPLPPPSPLLIILPKGAQTRLFLVEVLQKDISTSSKGAPPVAELVSGVEVSSHRGGSMCFKE